MLQLVERFASCPPLNAHSLRQATTVLHQAAGTAPCSTSSTSRAYPSAATTLLRAAAPLATGATAVPAAAAASAVKALQQRRQQPAPQQLRQNRSRQQRRLIRLGEPSQWTRQQCTWTATPITQQQQQRAWVACSAAACSSRMRSNSSSRRLVSLHPCTTMAAPQLTHCSRAQASGCCSGRRQCCSSSLHHPSRHTMGRHHPRHRPPLGSRPSAHPATSRSHESTVDSLPP